jgi:hypothetical protein
MQFLLALYAGAAVVGSLLPDLALAGITRAFMPRDCQIIQVISRKPRRCSWSCLACRIECLGPCLAAIHRIRVRGIQAFVMRVH